MAQDMAYQPLVLVDTAQLSRPDWLEYRRKGLGGSDAAAVLNISPFRTARDLYYDKLGIVTADDQANWVALEVGNLLEPLVARIFAEKTGLKIYQRKCMFQHPCYPWMLADLDYLVELPDGTTAILEIKTTNYNAKDKWWYNGEEIVPAYYETQGRHYSAIHDGLSEIESLRDRDEVLEDLWEQFGDIPMDPQTECIEAPFMGWGPGIHRTEIWSWFDVRHSKGVAYLLYGTGFDRTPEAARLLYLKQLCVKCETRNCRFNDSGECRFALVHERKPRIHDTDDCIDCACQEDGK